MIFRATSRYENNKINWDEPQVSHPIHDDCKFEGWHSIMACHLVKRLEVFPTVFWHLEVK